MSTLEAERVARARSLWRGMFNRCYNASSLRRKPAYKGCSVEIRFHSIEYFSKWATDQIGFDEPGWQMDKDILVPGNKVYSPETCAFVPMELNQIFTERKFATKSLPTGVYLGESCGRIRVKKYVATLSINDFSLHLGRFATISEAFHVYKIRKEQSIFDKAMKWRSQLSPRVYEALMRFEVPTTE